MKEKEFERRLDKKIQDHAKIMSDEKRKIQMMMKKQVCFISIKNLLQRLQ